MITGKLLNDTVHLLRYKGTHLSARCGSERRVYGYATGQPVTCLKCAAILVGERAQEQREQISAAVLGAAPTCSYADGQPDRFRVWMTDNSVIKGRTKAELRANLEQAVAAGKVVSL
jgi:hypothetical protein